MNIFLKINSDIDYKQRILWISFTINVRISVGLGFYIKNFNVIGVNIDNFIINYIYCCDFISNHAK